MVDDIEADGTGSGRQVVSCYVLLGGEDVQLVNVGVEDAVYEADAGGLVRVLIGEFDVDLP